MDIKDFMHMPKIKLAKNQLSSREIQAPIKLGHGQHVFQNKADVVSWTQSGATEMAV